MVSIFILQQQQQQQEFCNLISRLIAESNISIYILYINLTFICMRG